MNNKVYELLPGHLRNKKLESYFDATIERAFSKGTVDKTRGYVGRKERGIYKVNQPYITYPTSSINRENYSFEPVYSNTTIGDNIFYDDLLNALYNKGALINDHRRLFPTEFESLNLPINKDMFINFEMYYWVGVDFGDTVNGVDMTALYTNDVSYITMARGENNWWSLHNAWFHYDDIKDLITVDNKEFIHQAKRPIIEFDNRLELSDTSATKDVTTYEFEEPTFKSYNVTNSETTDIKIFSYVTGDYPYDVELNMNPKMVAGDYASEFAFIFDLVENTYVNLSDGGTLTPYIATSFDYRNYRQEYNTDEEKSRFVFNETPKDGTVEVYVDGVKQFDGFTVTNKAVTLDTPTTEYVYIDYAVDGNVTTNAKGSFQRINPSLEYNPENETYVNVELTFSNVFEHFVRIIETTYGITGEPISNNNYRELITYGDNISDNSNGSVLIRNTKDLGLGYFTITRDDYDPLLAADFLSSAYSNFKSRFIMEVRNILNTPVGDRSNSDIIEEVLTSMARTRNSVVRIFEGSGMVQIGTKYNHYEELVVANVVGSSEQFMPDFDNPVVDDMSIEVYLNDMLLRLGVDYTITPTGGEIIFTDYVVASTDVIVVRNYFKSEDSKMPPSATFLGIYPSFVPQIITDEEYETPVDFIVGHDGSKTPVWGDRTDDILLELETKIYNTLPTKNTVDAYMDNAVFWNSSNGYSVAEKNYIMYPFFKKWMRKNEIDNLFNTEFDITDWKTWNYKVLDDALPGNWRGIYEYFYGTDQILIEPWRILGYSQKPENFDADYGTDYTSVAFWQYLIADAGMLVPIPVNTNGTIKSIEELIGFVIDDINDLNVDWEFGDRSPVEMAWRRSSDFAFATFSHTFLQKPFDTSYDYKTIIETMIRYFAKRDSINVDQAKNEKENYEFKLGSKLAGFVNNFKLLSENTSLANSRYTEIPSDNYELFVHTGEASRSLNLSGIVVEKVSLDNQYPTYTIADTNSYKIGDVVVNPSDGKYYKRKVDSQTTKEAAGSIVFDYAAWILVPQPKIREIGYRVYGYNDFNPTFYTLNWDTTSGEKVFETNGEKLKINNWKQNTLYKVDHYVLYNGAPYVCVEEHTSTTQFSDNLTSWKALREWPRTNKVYAYGYNEVLQDSVKTYNYGDVLSTKDEVAHLLVGYQEYLKQMGWDFTDMFDDQTVVDFESLLVKFLEWSVEIHEPGEYISLTPILRTGSFNAVMGTPSITRETYKNYYRVVDENGNKISTNEIEFHIAGNQISWESTKPVYSITVDIVDIEHAFVVDREDSYGDLIYNPLTHDRNLRMIVDCNRASNWNGTLEIAGYIVYGNDMIPNFETMAEEFKYYRDTIVDQSLENLNHLKASHIGFTPRTYLSNMNMERESQLEFYKGFISEKGSVKSIDRLVNLETNIQDIQKSDVWALKLSDFGNQNSRKTFTVTRENLQNKDNPVQIDYDNYSHPFPMTNRGMDAAVRTSGYVDYRNVNYIVQNIQALETLDTTNVFEGDIAWIQFEEDREWDVRRLSEIAEIDFVGETSDGQLYIALTNTVDTSKPVFLKIENDNIDPQIKGYYYLVFEEELTIEGLSVYKYIVFETNYEPLIVEIDDLTSNSVYVPTPTDSTIEAIGSVSNPSFANGDTLFIDGVEYVYDSSNVTGSVVTILADISAVDPFVQMGETIRLVVYDNTGAVVNNNTSVEFLGTTAVTNGTFNLVIGDQFTIEGQTITVDPSDIRTISITSDNQETINTPSGTTFVINDGNTDVVSYTIEDIVIDGTVTNPTISQTKSISVNGTVITFTVPSPITGPNSSEVFAGISTPVASVVLTTDMTYFVPGDIEVDNGTDQYTLTTADYSYISSSQTILFDAPIADGLDGDGVATVSVTLIAQPAPQSLDIDDIVSTINTSSAPITAENISGSIRITHTGAKLTMTGTALIDMGLSTTSIYENSKFRMVANVVDAVTNFQSYVDGNGKLVITTTEDSISVSGSALQYMGIDGGTYTSISDPTPSSVVNQINALSIDGVSAIVDGSYIMISRNASSLSMDSVSSNALTRMGFDTDTVSVDSLTVIVDQINESIFTNDINVGLASIENRRLKIVSPNRSISITNISGNPLSDLGIESGTYTASQQTVSSALAFSNQINASVDNNGVTVSISSDGRMIFKSDNSTMTFLGTMQNILDKIGLYRDYSSVTSNQDFKVMRWKSVRYTPRYNGNSFEEFYNNLGLNAESYIWADSYNDLGWAVLRRLTNGTIEYVRRQAQRVDTQMFNRVVVRDQSNNSYIYDIFDPVNGIFTGELARNLKYISWEDPAKYSHSHSKEKWLDDHIGKFWWDTSTARYFRYNDMGDENGNLDMAMAKRYWGRLVEGSEIKVYRWSSDTTIPEGVSNYNQYTYFDPKKNTNITKYYFWTEQSINQNSNEYTPNDMKLLIEGAGNKDRFIPVTQNTVLLNINNSNAFVGASAEYTVDYYVSNIKVKSHDEWHLLSETDNNPVPAAYYDQMIHSVMDGEIAYEYAEVIYEPVLRPSGDVKLEGYDVTQGLTPLNTVITHNSKIVSPIHIQFNQSNIRIWNTLNVIEGDVIRVYKLKETNNWFADLSEARRTFARVVNDYMKRQFLTGFANNWYEYIAENDFIFKMSDWSLNDNFDVIEKYAYLSKTINFDMNTLYNEGVTSFKVEEDEYTAYYFEVDGTLRMVRKSGESLSVSYSNVFIPDSEDAIYYQNAMAVQTYELMNMLDIYASSEFKKNLFVSMLKYLLTEKTYPEWVFKTSYFDLVMYNNRLRQSAVYLRDSYQDMIDYINETKPYHAKIRETKNIHTVDETVPLVAESDYTINIHMDFGKVENYTFVVDETFDANPVIVDIANEFSISTAEGTYVVYSNGKKVEEQYYTIENGDLIFESYGDILDGSVQPSFRIEVGDIITVSKGISRYKMRTIDGTADTSVLSSYNGGILLTQVTTNTDFGGGIDTGFVSAYARDIVVFEKVDYTDETRTTETGKQFYVYDQFGRGYIVEVDKTGTINSFDGTNIVVNQQSYFKSAKDDSVRMVIVENSSRREFILYDKKDGTSLRIKDRGVYTGEIGDFSNGDTIYSVKTIRQI